MLILIRVTLKLESSCVKIILFCISNFHHNCILRKTVELCKQAEKAGVSWITVHGRTVKQRGEPANWEAIKLVLNILD